MITLKILSLYCFSSELRSSIKGQRLKRTKASLKHRNPLLEDLEDRLTPVVASSSLNLVTGVLAIRCTDTPTQSSIKITRSQVGGLVVERLNVIEGANTSKGSYLASQIKKIEFTGGIANDSFNAAAARIRIQALGNDGNDTIVGGSGTNTIDGGNGNDLLSGAGASYYYGQDGNDTINAGEGVDNIEGNSGNDSIFSGGGNDVVYGGAGLDNINGGDGNDRIYGEADNDGLSGGTGNDSIWGGLGADGISGNDGNDMIRGEADNDVILGGNGNDDIQGNQGEDIIAGDNDNDTIQGNEENDILRGNAGNDTVRGGAGADQIDGADGNDWLYGDTENDVINGGTGLDTIEGNGGDDTLRGDNDADNIRGGNGADLVYGGLGNDSIFGESGIDQLFGDGGNDTANGGEGDDRIHGGDGNDSLIGETGYDLIRGGLGNDTIDGGTQNDMLMGGEGNDSVSGGDGDDTVNGEEGSDRLFGGNGDDSLVALDDLYTDTLRGDAGRDAFWYDSSSIVGTVVQGDTRLDLTVQDADNYVRASNLITPGGQPLGFAFRNFGMDRTLNGDNITNPGLTGLNYQSFAGRPLFPQAGPRGEDIDQGLVGDCMILSSFSAMAHNSVGGDGWSIRRSIVDFGDGTYGISMANNFRLRINADLPVDANGQLVFAKLGRENSLWVPLLEKAIVYFSNWASVYGIAGVQANAPLNYASLDFDPRFPLDMYQYFGSTSTGTVFPFSNDGTGYGSFGSQYANPTSMANDLYSRWNSYQNVSLVIDDNNYAMGLPVNHAYTLWQVNRNPAGVVTTIVLRNPWGVDGGTTYGGAVTAYQDANPNDGLITLTPAQLFVTTPGFKNNGCYLWWGSAIV